MSLMLVAVLFPLLLIRLALWLTGESFMPWKPSDVSGKTKKATTPKKKRQWSKIANKLLASGKPEGEAIKEANGVIKREHKLYGGKK